jgi:[acyl-carrier-protein] S-malonyltransferase
MEQFLFYSSFFNLEIILITKKFRGDYVKIAFMFSGQGSQYNTMGLDMYKNYRPCKEIFDNIDNSLNFKLTDILFKENKLLNETEYTQSAVFSVSAALYEVVKERIKPDYVLGISSGEYTALYASGAISLEQTVRILKKRGESMGEASKINPGGMSAFIGLNSDEIEEICEKANKVGFLTACNYNMPNQIVLGGEKEALIEAEYLASEMRKRVVRLPVSGAFHTKFMNPAAEKLQKELAEIKFSQMGIPVISNLTALPIENVSDIEETLVKQVTSPVLFEKSIRYLISEGVDTFIEIGTDKTLSSFVKRIDKNVCVYSVYDKTTYEKLRNSPKECLNVKE